MQASEDGHVNAIKSMKDANVWVNGGYFVLRKEVFRYINPGEELIYEPFQRLITEGKVWSQRYEGFWQCMDTFRDKQILDELEASGKAPWRSVEEWPAGGRDSRVINLTVPSKAKAPFSVLCLGAHADDIEIGCGGTLLHLKRMLPKAEVSLGGLQRSGASEAGGHEVRRAFHGGLRKGDPS